MTYRDVLRDNLPAALEAEPRAIERLLTAVRPIVVRYCRARMGSTGESFAAADDVAREACLAVLSSLPGYRDDGRPFLAFLHDILVKTVSRAAGEQTRTPLDSLPAVQRDIVILRTLVGLSTEETAEAVGMSPGGVRLAQHRALRQLRATMGGD